MAPGPSIMPRPRALPSAPCAHPTPRGASSRPAPKKVLWEGADDDCPEPIWDDLPDKLCLGAIQAVAAKMVVDLDNLDSVLDLDTVGYPTSGSPVAADGLDEISFRNFAPLLAANQQYAGHTGCRFRGGSFDGLDDLMESLEQLTSNGKALERDDGTDSRLAAKLHAVPAIRSFSDRLASGEPALLEELDKAFRIIVAESARNMMIATVKGLGLFPPSPRPEGINEEDCSYEDASAPLQVIAQRLYNDHERRRKDACSSARRQQKRSLTAAFLVDFAHEVGHALPPIPETYQTLLQDFSARHCEFNEQEGAASDDSPLQDAVPSEYGPGSEDSYVPAKADASQTGWLQRLFFPGAGTPAVSEAQKAPQGRRQRQSGCV